MNFIKKRLRHFFDKRAKLSDTATFGLNNIYVFFSRQGILFLLLLITTFVTGTNYGNNLVLGVFFYLFSVWAVSCFVTFTQVAKLTLQLNSISLSPSGDVAWVDIVAHTTGKSIHQIELYFDNPTDIYEQLSDDKKQLFTTHAKLTTAIIDKPATISLPVLTTKRGAMTLPRLVVKTQYPLGVVMAWSYVRFASVAWIYPKPKSFDWQLIKNTSTGDTAHDSNYYRQGQNDFDMLDTYKQGESLSRVSWQHVARGAGFLTKQFADQVGDKRSLNYQDMPAVHHEDKLSELAFAVIELGKTGTPFILSLPEQTTQLGVGDEFVKSCLLLLAKSP